MSRPKATAASRAQRAIDERHLARCLELARRFAGRTAPNPIVGCVIVDADGEVVAEGAHRKAGTAHAEVVALAALRKAGRSARGGTLYVNLEPCNHTGRTGPCAPAVRDSGVARVVIGMLDPVPGHGGGAGLLRRAGVQVTTGVLRAACERANGPWITAMTRKRASFTLKAAITLDGKIATVTGHAKYVTGEAARADVMRLRDTHDAILVGIGTLLADDPWLTVRGVRGGRDPVRVILDSALRTPPTARALPAIIACGPRASAAKEKALVAAGCQVWRLPAHRDGRLDGHALARRLAAAGLHAVLVEGGGQVHAYLIEQRLCDELVLYVAPKVIGGPAPSWVGGAGLAHMGSAVPFELDADVVRLGDDLRLTGRLAADQRR